jgi:uncharacterized sporulation protein YeaH/YhbH (DUF444 family)
MNPKLLNFFNTIKERGIDSERERKILKELQDDGIHEIPTESSRTMDKESKAPFRRSDDIYEYNDFSTLQSMPTLRGLSSNSLQSLDELLERDNQREKDGFPRKIRVGRLIKPGRGGKEKIVVVPTTVEEKFLHDIHFDPSEEEPVAGGAGEGEEGEIIGEQPVHEENGSGTGPGEGSGGPHEVESSAYDLGRILSEQFELPNIKNKGKKRFFSHYTYDMTDRNRGVGQFLDKKATLKKIVETNISLGNIPDIGDIDPSRFLISPKDKIYRILSREKKYESQALIFFMRDYSGSMQGKATELVVTQHVLVYSWLLYQYEKRVECRFILHDTEATEVKDFYTYYNSRVAGGTKVSSAFQLANKIVENENLAQDYNIYVFYGTDGDDWDTDGKEAIPEIEKMLTYSNRTGITIAEHMYGTDGGTEVEKYIKNSGLLEKNPDLLRLDVMKEDSDEPRLIEGIKKLISQAG